MLDAVLLGDIVLQLQLIASLLVCVGMHIHVAINLFDTKCSQVM